MDNKQKAGDNSSNTINYITNNIHNDEKFIRDTCGDVCKEMLKDLTDDAFNTSLVLKGDFEDNLIKNLADKTINLEKFKSPGTQILLVKIFSEYFKNPTEQVKEILIKIIVNILKEENRSRKSILLDKSVELIGLLSSDDIRKIYFLFNLFYIETKSACSTNLVAFYDKLFSYYNSGDYSEKDLAYLFNCGIFNNSYNIAIRNKFDEFFSNKIINKMSNIINDDAGLSLIFSKGNLNNCIDDFFAIFKKEINDFRIEFDKMSTLFFTPLGIVVGSIIFEVFDKTSIDITSLI